MIAIRRMQIAELEQLAEFDRSEHVREIYVNRDGELIRKDVDWHIPLLPPEEITRWRAMLAAGSTMLGAFDGETLAGFSIDRPDLSQDTAQLAALYVSKNFRGRKIGISLLEKVAGTARAEGAKKLYVSSTPTAATVDFYMSQGFAVTEEVNEHLYELEPEDIHMIRNL